MDSASFKSFATDAIRYWEPRRLIYNAVLAAIVVIYFVKGYPASKVHVEINEILALVLLAVLANIAYCAAYVVDIFAQASDFRDQWRKYCWILFLIGTAFAGIITRFFALVWFSPNG